MLGISLKSALAHRLRLALTTLAVMLGVTFVTGTLTYTDALNGVFTSMVEEGTAGVDVYVAPKTEFESLMDYGAGGPGLPESMVETVESVPGVAVANGAVTGYAQFVDKKGKAITPFGPPTLGISWTEDPGLSSVRLTDGRAPSGPGEVLMDAVTAADHGFQVGDQVEVLLQGPKETFDLVGIIDTPSGSGFGGATMAAFEMETAQKLFKKKGRVDQIEVAAEEGTSATELRNLLAAELPDNVELKTGTAQAQETKKQIQQGFGFFTTVLLVFAAVAVFVGAFIIFNTFSIIVAQRTKEFGLLRAIGASGRQVMTSVLVEAALIAAVASALGILLGLGLAVGLQNLMDAVGIDLPAATLELAPRTIVVGFLVGFGVTMFSALLPARRAARISPVAAMQEVRTEDDSLSSRRIYLALAVTILGALVMGAGLLSLVPEEVSVVGLGALLVFLGVAGLGPVFARSLAGALGSPLPKLFGITGTLARENSRRSPRRTSSTAAALMVGLALVTLVAMFASSLKASIDSALSSTVKADLIVMGQSFATTGFSPRIARDLAQLPEVELASPFRFGEWKGSDGGTRTLLGVDPQTIDHVMELGLIEGSLDEFQDGGLLMRDVEAEGRGISAGDSIEMTFAATGKQTIPLVGVFSGEIDDRYLLALPTYEDNFTRQQDLQVHLLTAPGVSPDEMRTAVEGRLEEFPNVRVLDQAGLREESSRLIDQMLNMVYGLLALALIIAVLGITNTLALSVHERRREVGLLRAVGASRSQVRRMIRWEAAIIAVFGTVMGVVVGTAFGWALISTLRDDGFSETVLPWVQIIIFVVIAAIAGLLAAVLPARRAARLDVLDAIAFE